MLWLGLSVDVHARGRRAVPDLRRDAQRWAQPYRAARLKLPVTIHVATDEGDAVVGRARVARWLRVANDELAPFGIEVVVRSVRYLPPGWNAVTKWQQRRQLARYAPSDGSIHVFIIEQLDARRRLVRRRIRGLHWRYRGLRRNLRSREYLVVTRDAPSTTFAHELGHLFGLRHSTSPTNIMCSCRSGNDLGFTIGQGVAMRDGAARFARRQAFSTRRSAADRRRRR